MNQTKFYYRDKITRGIYIGILKPIFFKSDPEVMHDRMTKVGIVLGRHSFGRKLIGALFGYQSPMLEQKILGIDFKNPIGLSAGFDKNAELTDILPSVGFGFAEVGSVTGEPCLGNPKPRLWRLPKSKSLLVYYGLKNDGAKVVAKRLANKHFGIPIGISVAMTNSKENLNIEKAIADYAKAFSIMEPISNYITVNISCPNTEGGQPFIIRENLARLLDVLDKIPCQKPVFLKLTPDLKRAELSELLDIAESHRVHGIICANLTKKRENSKILDIDIPEVGGMSGKIVQDLSDDMLGYIHERAGDRFILIGSGGVSSAEDAYRKIRLGASLVQMITGMIFEGPQVMSEINQGLVKLLKRDGFKNISDAVGKNQRVK